MKYAETLQAVNPITVLKALGRSVRTEGAYIYFSCPCGKTAAMKAYGEKKGLWICNHCKAKGHIISLAMFIKEMEWEQTKEWLKPYCSPLKRSLTDLPFRYELVYSDILEKKGLSKEFCQAQGIGKPKGKTMLAGCIAFEIRDQGKVVAYYGIRIKDGTGVCHRSFNPELYLYEQEGHDGDVILTHDMSECALHWSKGEGAVCNFGHPYLSDAQVELLRKYRSVTYEGDSWEITSQLKKVYKKMCN